MFVYIVFCLGCAYVSAQERGCRTRWFWGAREYRVPITPKLANLLVTCPTPPEGT